MIVSMGKSEKDRIMFYSGEYSAVAIRHKNGEIETSYKDDSLKLSKLKLSKALRTIGVIFGGISIIKVYGVLPLINNGSINVIWYLLPAFIYMAISIFAVISVRLSGKESFLRNHGAEHKVLRAFNDLKRIPTIDEAKKHSRISKNCGVTIYSAFIVSQIIGFFVFWKFGYKISEIILFLVPFLFSSCFPFNILGNFAQFFTTKEPTDESLELAIAALSALERRIENLESDVVLNIKSLMEDFDKNIYRGGNSNE